MRKVQILSAGIRGREHDAIGALLRNGLQIFRVVGHDLLKPQGIRIGLTGVAFGVLQVKSGLVTCFL